MRGLLAHRLMVSGSDRHASTWRQSLCLPGADTLTLDHAYKAMAWLGEKIGEGRVMTDAIKEAPVQDYQKFRVWAMTMRGKGTSYGKTQTAGYS